MPVRAIPEGYASVTPYLVVAGASKAIDFYKKAFGAIELMRFAAPDGKVMHAELGIGDSRIMLADEMPEMGYRAPQSAGATGTGIMLYVTDVDRVFGDALAAGATSRQDVKDQFYGDRSGALIDPFGHLWTVATHVEDVSSEEMQRRAQAAMAGQANR
jgi:PhnB protein